MSGEVIKEYLVACGFDIDEAQLAKFNGFVERAGRTVEAFGKDMLATGLTLGATVEEMSRKLEDFYYVAARSNTTISNLMAVRYAADQVGVGADNMTSAIGGVAHALRANPVGFGGLLSGLGVATTVNGKLRDTVDITTDLIDRLKDMGGPGTQGFAIAQRYAQMLGIDPDMLLMLERGNEDFKRFEADSKARTKESGVDFDKLGEKSRDFQRNLRAIGSDFDIFRSELLADVIDPAIWATKELEALFREFNSTGPGPDKWIAGIIVSMGLWKAAAVGLRAILATLGVTATAAAAEVRAAAVAAGATGGAAPAAASAASGAAPVAAEAATGAAAAGAASVTRTAKAIGSVKKLDPAMAEGLAVGLAWEQSRKDEADWQAALADAKKRYAGHMDQLKNWVDQYRKDHPFVVTPAEENRVLGTPETPGPFESFYERSWGWAKRHASEWMKEHAIKKPDAAVPPSGAEPAAPSSTAPKPGATNYVPDANRSDIQKIADVEKHYNLPNGLLYGTYGAESSFGKDTRDSYKGAQGPLQFMPGTAKRYGVDDPHDLTQAANGAARYYTDLLREFSGDANKAEASYNWGEDHVEKDVAKWGAAWRDHLPKETADYVNKINLYRDQIAKNIHPSAAPEQTARLDSSVPHPNTPPRDNIMPRSQQPMAFSASLAPSPSQIVNTINQTNNNTVNVNGVSDPKEAGNEVTGGLSRVNGNLLRNLQSVSSGRNSGISN